MKIILSPAKKMVSEDVFGYKQLPYFLKQAERLKNYMQALPLHALQELLNCSDTIAEQNYKRFQNMDLTRKLSPALFSYDGIQYTYMVPQVLSSSALDYLEGRLRILSGLYGILKPFDGITPYRLEMQAKVKTDFCVNLYDYWKDSLYEHITTDDQLILNLASAEYSRIITKYLKPPVSIINCTFGEWINGAVHEKGVYVKMARGAMVRFLAENQIEDLEEIKRFNALNFAYNKTLSTTNHFVFLKG